MKIVPFNSSKPADPSLKTCYSKKILIKLFIRLVELCVCKEFS